MSKNNLTFTGVLFKEGKGYTSLCIELDIASQGNILREAKDALVEATALYLEGAIESNLPYMRPVPPGDDPRRVTPKQVVETFPLKVNIAVRAYA